MRLGDIVTYLDEISPFELAESWDNCGLLVGQSDQEIENVYLSIDLDSKMLEQIPSNSLIITHHPLVFKGLKKFDATKYPVNILQILMKKDIALVSLHTNFDKTHLNRYVSKKVLGFDVVCEQDFVCLCEVDMSFDEFTFYISKKLKLDNFRFVKSHERVRKLAITTGSGMDLLENIKCDTFLTGDIKYHQALSAKENKISLIDIGHFESERYFGDSLLEDLKKIQIKAIIINSKNPFDFYTSN